MFPGAGSADLAGLDVSKLGCNCRDHLEHQQKTSGSTPFSVIYLNTTRPSNTPSQFYGSYLGSTAMLTITGVQAEEEDEAVYYCGGYDSSSTAGSDRGRCEIEVQPRIKNGCFLPFSLRITLGCVTQAGFPLPALNVFPVLPQCMEGYSSRYPGETIKITCSRGSSGCGYSWYQMKTLGSAYVTVWYSNTKRTSGIPP
uniref:Ig-like domain-containing protein n=1 Tax=Pavo cristatus TaxID=9049 RepID=A0A8C9EPI6_PAVCR